MGKVERTIEIPRAILSDKKESLEGETIGDGRYTLGRIIGDGGLGPVYHATEKGTNREWAIKEIRFENPEAFEAQLQQDQTLLNISHKTIVARQDVVQDRDRFFLVTEYVEGTNLLERITNSKTAMPEKAVVELALQLTDALVYLHSQTPEPIVFADLKPSKLLLTSAGELRLVNYGIGRVKRPDSEDGPSSGTRGYASPEQHKGQELEPRTDIYAVGIVMHQLLSKLDPTEIRGELPRLSDTVPGVDENLAKVIARATALDPKRRYPTAQRLRARLSKFLEQWKLARPDARRLAVEWSGQTPRGGPLRTRVSEAAKEAHRKKQAQAEAEKYEREKAAVTQAPRQQKESYLWFKVLVVSIVASGLFLARNGFDISDAFFYGMLSLVGIVYWGSR